jgi:peptidoglycan/xylan/chitin deacetylase (PgdA/CDA1 family)
MRKRIVLFTSLALGCVFTLVLSVYPQYGSKGSGSNELGRFGWPEGKRGAISLTFDDGRASQIENGIPVLDRHRVKATFYINPGNITDRVDAWRKVAAAGHEIGNHSSEHPCTGNFSWSRDSALEDYNLDSMRAELEGADTEIKRLLGISPKAFAYPCGQKFVGRGKDTRSYVSLIAEMFGSGRGWMDEATNDPLYCDLAQLMGTELDGLSFNEAKLLVDQAVTEGRWLVFCGHDIGDPARQTVVTGTLDQICRYANDPANGIWIDTVSNIASYVKQERE